MLLSEGYVLLEASHPDLKQKYKTLSVFCCFSLSPPPLLDHIITLIPHKKVSLSHQTVGGPRPSAARCTMLITTVAGRRSFASLRTLLCTVQLCDWK